MKKGLVVIMRGLPGSGKSTHIRENFPGAVICSADHFQSRSGKYVYDPDKEDEAHSYSRNTFKDALEKSASLVVVDNTCTELYEFEEYVKLAEEHNYEVHIIRIKVSPKTAIKRNIHKVPEDKIWEMHERFDDYPNEEVIIED